MQLVCSAGEGLSDEAQADAVNQAAARAAAAVCFEDLMALLHVTNVVAKDERSAIGVVGEAMVGKLWDLKRYLESAAPELKAAFDAEDEVRNG